MLASGADALKLFPAEAQTRQCHAFFARPRAGMILLRLPRAGVFGNDGSVPVDPGGARSGLTGIIVWSTACGICPMIASISQMNGSAVICSRPAGRWLRNNLHDFVITLRLGLKFEVAKDCLR